MAWAHVAIRGTAVSASSASTLNVVPTGTIPVGAVLIVRATSYNFATVNGASNNHLTVTDTQGNTYQKLGEETETSGAAGDGSAGSAWISVITTALTTADTVTLTLSGSTTHKTLSLSEFSLGAGNTVSILSPAGQASQRAATTISATKGSLPSAEYLFIGMIGWRRVATDTETFDADYTTDVAVFDTGTGSNSARLKQWGQYRIATLTTDTFSGGNSTAGSSVAILAVLREDADAPGGVLKHYTGTAWALVTSGVKAYSGSAFVAKPLKRWDGGAWLEVGT